MLKNLTRLAILMAALGLVFGCTSDDDDDDSGSLETAQEPADLSSTDSVTEVAGGVQEVAVEGTEPGIGMPESPTPDGDKENFALSAVTHVALSPYTVESSVEEMCEGGGSVTATPDPEDWDGTGELEMIFDNCATFFGVWDGRIWIHATETPDGEIVEMEYGDGDTPFSMDFEMEGDSMYMSFSGDMYFEQPAENPPAGFGSLTMHFASNWEIDWDFDVSDGPSGWLVAFYEDFEVYDDDNYVDVSGRFGIHSSGLECGVGSVTVDTEETLVYGAGSTFVDGRLSFSNEGGTAYVDYNADGTVTITAGEETATVDQGELVGDCEVSMEM